MKNLFKSGVFVLVIVVIGMVAFLATGIWDPSWNPFESPRAVIKKMTATMAEVKAVSSEGEMYFEAGSLEETARMKIDFKVNADEIDPENPKGEMEFNFELMSDPESFSFAFDVKIIGEIIYLKMKDISEIPDETLYMWQEMGIDFSEFSGQWIKIDEDSIRSFYEATGQDPAKIDKMIKDNEEMQEKYKEISEELLELIKKRAPDLLKVKKTLPDKEIDGVEVYHYLVVLDKGGVKKTIPELIETTEDMFFTILEEQYGAMVVGMFKAQWKDQKEELLEELDKGLDEFFDKSGDISAELWIGKKDYYLYKVEFEKFIDIKHFLPEESGEMTLGLNINYSDFNQSITVEPPQEYKSLEEILIPLFEASMARRRSMIELERMDDLYYYEDDFWQSDDFDFQIQFPESQATEPSLSFFKNLPQFLQASFFMISF